MTRNPSRAKNRATSDPINPQEPEIKIEGGIGVFTVKPSSNYVANGDFSNTCSYVLIRFGCLKLKALIEPAAGYG
jgi:hypothetical protein